MEIEDITIYKLNFKDACDILREHLKCDNTAAVQFTDNSGKNVAGIDYVIVRKSKKTEDREI